MSACVCALESEMAQKTAQISRKQLQFSSPYFDPPSEHVPPQSGRGPGSCVLRPGCPGQLSARRQKGRTDWNFEPAASG